MIRALPGLLCLLCCLHPSATAAGEQVVCKGDVVGADGKGLPDVSVRLYDVTVGMEGFKATPAGQTLTKSDGTFVLTHEAAETGKPGCTGMILAGKGDLAIDWANWHYDADVQVKLTLGEPGRLAGQVVDEAGAGIAGVEVGAFLIAAGNDAQGQPRVTYGLPPAEWTVTRTDTDGAFSFGNLPPDCTGELLAWAPGRARVFTLPDQPQGTKGQFAPGATDIKIVLPPEAVIEGTVVDKERHEGVGGVGVFVRTERAASYIESSPVVSDANGRFRFSGLRPGHYSLGLVPSKSEQPAWVAEPAYLALGAGEVRSGLTFEVLQGGLIEVLVTDPVANEPVEGASVWMTNEDTKQYVVGVTDKVGVARIAVAPGRYAGESLRKGQDRVWQFDQKAVVSAGQVCRLAAQLGEPQMLKGVVLDPNGRPVLNAEVRLFPGAERAVRTDPVGRFELPVRLQSWRPAGRGGPVLLARHPRRDLAALVELDENAKTAEVRLAPSTTIAGRIVLEDGKPAPNAQVSFEIAPAGEAFVTVETTNSGQDGRYEMTGIPAGGRCRISAHDVPGYGGGEVEVKVDKDQKGKTAAADVVLPLADAAVSGVVVDEEGRPLGGAIISSVGLHQPSRRATADEQGRFKLEGVCKGRIRLSAEAPGTERAYGGGLFEVGAGELKIVVKRLAGHAASRPASGIAEPAAPPASNE